MTLPKPTHPLGFAPYYPYWGGGDDWDHVKVFSSELYCWPARMFGDSETPSAVWIARAAVAVKRAVADKRKVHLNLDILNPDANVNAVLKALSGYWSSISRIEAQDEPKWSSAQCSAQIAHLKATIKNLGLSPKPIGAVYSQQQFPGGKAPSTALAWVGLECYVDPPGGSRSDNLAALDAYMVRAMKAVPAGKQIVLVGMSYDRNGTWGNPPNLVPLIKHAYRVGAADKRVVAFNCFSWLRKGGAATYPAVADAVAKCGMACL